MVNLVKHHDWQIRLNVYFSEIKRQPFNYDTNNCAHFATNGLSVMFENFDQLNVIKKFLKNDTFVKQIRSLKKDGFNDHVEFLASIFEQHKHYSQAKIGDIAVFQVENDTNLAVGFVFSENCFVMRENGLAIYSLDSALKVFST